LIQKFLLLTIFIGVAHAQIDYTIYNDLLAKYVYGKDVKYAQLLSEKAKMDQFTAILGTKSPDSHPDQFPSRNEKLAYWINAYNASILKLILDNYPIKSIKSINFIGPTIWWKKIILGGKKISYKALEDKIIRERFHDPRIHFAINCASKSCPPLIAEAYLPENLEAQLDASTTSFINDSSNFLVDKENLIIYMSSIFDWYKKDFVEWLAEVKGFIKPKILDYIKLYYKPELPSELNTYKIKFNDYDWSLNDFPQ